MPFDFYGKLRHCEPYKIKFEYGKVDMIVDLIQNDGMITLSNEHTSPYWQVLTKLKHEGADFVEVRVEKDNTVTITLIEENIDNDLSIEIAQHLLTME